MLENLISFTAGAIVGGSIVAVAARRIIVRIRADWKRASRLG